MNNVIYTIKYTLLNGVDKFEDVRSADELMAFINNAVSNQWIVVSIRRTAE